MAVNYGLLKESENEIMGEFRVFYDYIIEIQSTLYNSLITCKDQNITEEDFEGIQSMMKKSEIMHNDLLSNCIWLIQKNEPRASHLRFIIAIVYSIKSLLYISDGVVKIANFFYKKKIIAELFKEFLTAYEDTIELSKEIANSLTERDITAIIQNFKDKFDNYHQEIKNLVRKCAYIHDDNLYRDNQDLINFIINVGRLERLIERQENILSDFSYIG